MKFFYNIIFKIKRGLLFNAITRVVYLLFFLLIASIIVSKAIFLNIRKSTLLIIADLTIKYILLVLLVSVVIIYINIPLNFYLYFTLNRLATLHNITVLLQVVNKPLLIFNRYFEKSVLELSQVSVLNNIINISIGILNTKTIYLIRFIILLVIFLFL